MNPKRELLWGLWVGLLLFSLQGPEDLIIVYWVVMFWNLKAPALEVAIHVGSSLIRVPSTIWGPTHF